MAEKLTDNHIESGILNFDKDDVSVGDKLFSDDKADKRLLKQVSNVITSYSIHYTKLYDLRRRLYC